MVLDMELRGDHPRHARGEEVDLLRFVDALLERVIAVVGLVYCDVWDQVRGDQDGDRSAVT